MKKNNIVMRKLSAAIVLFLFISIIMTMFTGCFECNHENLQSDITREPTCGLSGQKVFRCPDCDYTSFNDLTPTGNHIFGQWIQSSETSMYRTCTVCGTAESSQLSTEDNNASTSDTYSYTSFSSFAADCLGESVLTYNGSSNKIVVSLGGGNDFNSCENKKVIIPARVTDVQFVGVTAGSPFSNFRIELEERINDINITFNDVRIESDSTVFTSMSRNINVNITMIGQSCSFINIGKGYDGADGIDGVTNDDPDVYGSDGGEGSPAFIIYGRATVVSKASILEIRGGNGGDGGDGGHIATSKAPNGGNGGDGGDAISGEELVSVYVAPNCVANIVGGAGGVGGAPGKSDIGYFGKNKTGNEGDPGSSGNTGCNIEYQ